MRKVRSGIIFHTVILYWYFSSSVSYNGGRRQELISMVRGSDGSYSETDVSNDIMVMSQSQKKTYRCRTGPTFYMGMANLSEKCSSRLTGEVH